MVLLLIAAVAQVAGVSEEQLRRPNDDYEPIRANGQAVSAGSQRSGCSTRRSDFISSAR